MSQLMCYENRELSILFWGRNWRGRGRRREETPAEEGK
jgi:hypothetical protein